MSRFANLEFNNESGSQSRSQPGAKNERFYLAEAQSAFEQGNFEQALRSFSKTLEHDPNNTTAWWDPLESTCRHASLSIL